MNNIKNLLEYVDYFNLSFDNLPDWLVCEDFCVRAIRTDVKYFFKVPKELLTEKVCLEALVNFDDNDTRFTLDDIHNHMPRPIET